MGLRDSIIALSPPWLVKGYDGAPGVGGRIMYALGLAMDVAVDKVSQATAARRPGIGDPTNLVPLGTDRVISRGVVESDTAYALRLTRAFDAWRQDGTARGVMSTVASWLTGASPRIWSVLQGPSTKPNSWDVYAAGADPTAAPTHTQVTPRNWNWDGLNRPKRRWLVIDAAGWFTSTLKCGTAGVKCGSGRTCGSDLPSSYGRTLRQLVDTWRSAGANWLWVVVTLDATYFPPAGAPGDPKLPDGTFGDWSKVVAGVQVPARFSIARYMSGAPGV